MNKKEIMAKYQAQWFNGEIHSIRELLEKAIDEATSKDIDKMVDRFLAWKLPSDFNPDGGISFNSNCSPIGTNLFTATQAKQMIENLIGDKK